MDEVAVEQQADAVIFRVRVSPRARRDRVGGVHAGALKVSLVAPPVDGAANASLVKLLAKTLGVRRADVTLVRGQSAREKTLRVSGTSADAVRALGRG